MRTVMSGIAIVMLATTATADFTYNFYNLTTNGPPDIGSQLRMVVSEPASGFVDFTFYNDVGTASSITEVYFDDGTLFLLHFPHTQSAGVSFTNTGTGSPPDLPGGEAIGFDATSGWVADTGGGGPGPGINNSGEWLTIHFELFGGLTIADTIAAIASGELRVGLHVISIDGGDSDSYVNEGMIPVPGAALLGVLGLGIAGWVKRRIA